MDSSSYLWVSDYYNCRFLRFPTPPSQYGQQANLLKAQPDFGSVYINWDGVNYQSNATPFPTGLKYPYNILLDPAGRLYVADRANSRVLRWNSPGSPTNPADFVFGQKGSFTSGQPNFDGNPAASTLAYPSAMDYDISNRLYIADSVNNRILRYSTPLTTYSADGVCGQAAYTHVSANFLDGTGFNTPQSIAMDTGSIPHHFYVADNLNNRVLCWSSVTSALQGMPADLVLGQPDLFSNSPGCSSFMLNGPCAVTLDQNSNIWVSDQYNHRIVGFQNPFLFDTSADYLIGQTSFLMGSPNMGGPNPGANTLDSPAGIFVDSSGRLWVADAFNNRVLMFSSPVATFDSAFRVWGQMDNLYTNDVDVGGTVTAFGLNIPVRISMNGSHDVLFITDKGNHKVLGYFGAVSGDTAADVVFGQAGCMDCSIKVRVGPVPPRFIKPCIGSPSPLRI